MKSAAEIRADRLRTQLVSFRHAEEIKSEACCDCCADEAKKTGKKVSCAGEKKPSPKQEQSFAQKIASALTDPIEEGKPAAVSQGPGGEHHTHAFIQRCVAAISEKNPGMDTGRAFAICTASKQKHPAAAKAKAKEGVPSERVKGYEAALKRGRERS